MKIVTAPTVRNVSFVWNELSQHMVIRIVGMFLSEHHILVVGDIQSGKSPESCVSGSGIYRCEFRGRCFELFVRYCEPQGTDRWLFYLDHERNRTRYPPGLGN